MKKSVMPSFSTSKRLQKEIAILNSDPPNHITASTVGDNLTHWQAMLDGPDGSPYVGGRFKLDINIPPDYPFKPPSLKFLCRVYHPNVHQDGSICLTLLKSEVWKPSTHIVEVLQEVLSLLANPNPDDALADEVAKVFKQDRNTFDQTAREWTEKYAR